MNGKCGNVFGRALKKLQFPGLTQNAPADAGKPRVRDLARGGVVRHGDQRDAIIRIVVFFWLNTVIAATMMRIMCGILLSTRTHLVHYPSEHPTMRNHRIMRDSLEDFRFVDYVRNWAQHGRGRGVSRPHFYVRIRHFACIHSILTRFDR